MWSGALLHVMGIHFNITVGIFNIEKATFGQNLLLFLFFLLLLYDTNKGDGGLCMKHAM
jgi:hypothetical protein